MNIIPLTKSDIEYNNISLQEKKSAKSELNLLVKKIKKDNLLPLKVPSKLIKPDSLIIAAQKDIKSKKAFSDTGYKGFYSTSRNVFDIFVHGDSVKRALNFSNSLILLLKKRGHRIEVKDGDFYNEKGTRLIIDGESFKICVRETRKLIRLQSSINKYMDKVYIKTGTLTLQIEDLANHKWSDAISRKIEDKLPDILAYLELKSKKEKIDRAKREAWHREYKLKLKIKEDLKVKQNSEIDAFKSLINSSGRWYKSQNLRSYLNEVENKSLQSNTLSDEKKEWLQWARKKADWYDPFIESDDDVFINIDRDSF